MIVASGISNSASNCTGSTLATSTGAVLFGWKLDFNSLFFRSFCLHWFGSGRGLPPALQRPVRPLPAPSLPIRRKGPLPRAGLTPQQVQEPQADRAALSPQSQVQPPAPLQMWRREFRTPQALETPQQARPLDPVQLSPARAMPSRPVPPVRPWQGPSQPAIPLRDSRQLLEPSVAVQQIVRY